MDNDQFGSEDELPSHLWGLDPVFSAFVRLYVKDVLQLKESTQVPGVYFYKSHPLFQVDILGTVVYRKEKEDFYCYGVDDSTGVINCLCWKDEKWTDHGDAKAAARAPGGGFNVEDQLRKLRQAQKNSSMLEIGDLLRVRGSLKTSREQREIMASAFYKVSDPVMDVQISRMLEMPQLYKNCYNKAFTLPPSELKAGITSAGDPENFPLLLDQSVHILKEFLSEKEVTRFRPHDVEYHLHPLVQQLGPNSTAERESGCASQIRRLLKESLKLLEVEGEIFRKVVSQDEVYNVTEQDKDLLSVICDVLKEDSKREKYAEKGCHILHILSAVRQRYSRNLSREALEVALRFLECNSHIISTMDSYYTVL